MGNSKNLKIGDLVEHERGYVGRVVDANYCDPKHYMEVLGYSETEAREICDNVEVKWFGSANGLAAPRTSVKYLTKIQE